MASVVKIKRSSVQGKAPTTSDLEQGEIALNTRDKKLFSSDGSSVFEVGSNVHSISVGTGGLSVGNGAISFPTSDGTSGQVLTTDGSGNITFGNMSSSSFAQSFNFYDSDGNLDSIEANANNQLSFYVSDGTLDYIRLTSSTVDEYLKVANASIYYEVANVNVLLADKMSVANTQALFTSAVANLVSTTNVQNYLAVSNATSLLADKMSVANTRALYNAVTANVISTVNVASYMSVSNTQTLHSSVTANLNSYIANTNPRIASFNSSGRVAAHLIPAANVTYDLGTTELAFRDLYLSGSTISIDGTTISANSSGFFFTDQDSNQTVNISSENGIIVNGSTVADGTGSLDADAVGQGFPQSTVTEIPTNYGADESYVGSAGASTDAFGVSLSSAFDCMEPIGRSGTAYDYGSIT